MSQYTILKNDCLSILAQRFNVTSEVLMSLNSEQIKDPNLIYEGNILILPEPQVVKLDGSRIQIPTPPENPLQGNDTCTTPAEYDDILYIPAHPKTGKKTWYAITKEARAKIEEENKLVASAVIEGDSESTMKNLSKLGVLSKFSSKLHEQFMLTGVAEQYKALLLAQLVINTSLFVIDNRYPNDYLIFVAEKADIDLSDMSESVEFWEEVKKAVIDSLIISSVNQVPAFTELQMKEKIKALNNLNSPEAERKLETSINYKLRYKVLGAIKEKIEDLEHQAERSATKITSDDGTQFVYYKSLKYFTSTYQLGLSNNLKDLNLHRERSHELLALSLHDNTLKYLTNWSSYLNSLKDIKRIHSRFAFTLRDVNQLGYVIKEQCLSLEQLEGTTDIAQGPKCLNKTIPDWRENDGSYSSPKAKPIEIEHLTLINQIYEEIGYSNEESEEKTLQSIIIGNTANWSYYPTLALIKVIDITLTQWKSDLNSVLGTNTPDGTFKKLLWIKKVANARLEQYKVIAQNKLNTLKGAEGLDICLCKQSTMPVALTLLWEEDKFKPKPMNRSGFMNESGFNELQMVECSLLSQGDVFYVRAPAWYMPESNSDKSCALAGGHVKNITDKISFAALQSSGEPAKESLTLQKALDSLKKNSNTELISLKVEKKADSLFWSDSYHYEGGQGPNGQSSQYSVDAGCQLLRFSTNASAELNTPFKSAQDLMNKPKEIGTSGSISGNLTVLQGQLNFSFWLPLNKSNKDKKSIEDKVEGYKLLIPYHTGTGRVHYPAGILYAQITGSVYGLAAASCQLSSQVTIG